MRMQTPDVISDLTQIFASVVNGIGAEDVNQKVSNHCMRTEL